MVKSGNAKNLKGEVLYKVTVRTADKAGAGTSARVSGKCGV